jgi:coproporphyrinogen III oxidase-like Fe-S oxidoreductase
MESNLKQKNYQNFETNDNALKNNNFNDDNFQNINDDFDYWGLGIGDWGLGPIPNPQSPIPHSSLLIKNI